MTRWRVYCGDLNETDPMEACIFSATTDSRDEMNDYLAYVLDQDLEIKQVPTQEKNEILRYHATGRPWWAHGREVNQEIIVYEY